MVGDKVTVKLNGKLVVDNVTMENYWERDKPIYPNGTIELQNHGNTLYFRNIYIKELRKVGRSDPAGPGQGPSGSLGVLNPFDLQIVERGHPRRSKQANPTNPFAGLATDRECLSLFVPRRSAEWADEDRL